MSRRKHKHASARRSFPPFAAPPTPSNPLAPAPAAAPARGAAADAGRPDGYHDSLPVRHRHAAGIDIGSRSHWVAGPPLVDGSPDVAAFDTCTAGLLALVEWLRQRGVTTVAMEATGIYGDILFALLEAEGVEVIQVNPAYTAQLKGRPKTDKLDCQWIQRLHAHGLLPASFRPAADVAVLRCYLRQRAEVVRAGARHLQQVQKALELMNVKLTEVVSDVTSLTGLKIIRAILEGERDPVLLARRRDKHCKHDPATFARALDGIWREEHLFALRQALASWEHYQAQQRDLEEQLARQVHRMKKSKELPPLPPKPRQRGRKPNEPRFDVRAALYYVTGVDVTELDGIDAVTALVVVSEIGLDRSKFPSVNHFCAWLGLCPRVKKTGGRVISSRTRKGKGRAARALCLAARSLWHSKGALGAFQRRLKARLGPPMAVTATAHKLARQLYHTLKTGKVPTKETEEAYAARQRQQAVEALRKKARRLGLTVVGPDGEVGGAAAPA
jgi:transposase